MLWMPRDWGWRSARGGIINNDKANTPHDVLHWQTGRSRPQWAVRQGDWKLIGNPKDTSNKAPLTTKDKLFLANLKESVSEMKNLAQANPEITQRLKKLHEDWTLKNAK